MVADHASVLVSAPSADMIKLAAFIKTLDIPQQLIRISVYRGLYPHKKSALIATTRSGNNRQLSAKVYAGQWLHVGTSDIVAIPISRDQLVAQTLPLLQQYYQQGIYHSNSQAKSHGEQYQAVTRQTGIYIRAYLAEQQQVRIEAEITTAADDNLSLAGAATATQGLTQSLNTHMTMALNQWVLLAEQQNSRYQPALNRNTKIYSTNSSRGNKAAQQHSVWLKVERLESK